MAKAKTITTTLLLIWCITPLLFLVFLSVSIQWLYPHILPQAITGVHWHSIFTPYNNITQSAAASLLIAIIVATLAVAVGFVVARFIAYHKYAKRLLTLAYFPFAISPVIFAVSLKFYFLKFGLAGNILGIIIGQLIIAIPYSIIFFTSFWNNSVHNLLNVAATLGSPYYYTMRHVVLPQAKPFIITCFFQCFLISWFEYGLTTVLGYGKVPTLTIKVYQYISEANTYNAALCCCLLIIPPLLLLWINKKIFLKHTS